MTYRSRKVKALLGLSILSLSLTGCNLGKSKSDVHNNPNRVPGPVERSQMILDQSREDALYNCDHGVGMASEANCDALRERATTEAGK